MIDRWVRQEKPVIAKKLQLLRSAGLACASGCAFGATISVRSAEVPAETRERCDVQRRANPSRKLRDLPAAFLESIYGRYPVPGQRISRAAKIARREGGSAHPIRREKTHLTLHCKVKALRIFSFFSLVDSCSPLPSPPGKSGERAGFGRGKRRGPRPRRTGTDGRPTC